MVICDDKNGNRLFHFMTEWGSKLILLFGINVLSETDLSVKYLNDSILHLIAPITKNTLDLIKKSKPNAIFAQGDNQKCVNFKSNVETYDYLITLIQTTEMPVTMFSTTETMIKLPKYNKQLQSSLGKNLHKDLFMMIFYVVRCLELLLILVIL